MVRPGVFHQQHDAFAKLGIGHGRKRPWASNSTRSLVSNVSGLTAGAWMTKVPSALVETWTPGKGVYHSEASEPLSRRMAMWDSVSVMP